MERDGGRREVQLALAGFGLTVAICIVCGYRLTIPYGYYQLLGADHLSQRLFESLFYLHAQPPLLNLALGVALKTSLWLGVAPEDLLLAAHVALGAAAVWGFARLSQRLVERALIRRVCIAVFVFHPALYLALFQYFYSFHELVLLCLIPLAAMASIESRRAVHYTLLCAGVTLLVYTHSLFHWAFAVSILAAVGWAALPETGSPRRHLISFAVTVALLLAWPAKNGLVFGEFSYSSWGGYSFALELPIPAERVPARRWDVPSEFRHIAVLSERNKIDGSRNWNHHSMIGHAHKLSAAALRTLGEDPLALLRKAGLNYWNYTRFSGRNPYTGNFGVAGSELPAFAAPWMRAYEVVLYLDLRSSESLAHRAYRTPDRTRNGTQGRQSWAMSGFVFAFPLLLACAGVALYRRWPATPPAQRTALALVLSILLWVLLATLLVDGSEANRIRFPTEPYLPLILSWLLASRSQRNPSQH